MASSIYRKLVPFGSRRDRFVWIAMVTLRKMREGPGPWFRAVKKGIYQLLPNSMQRRILKWTGQDAFFGSQTVRHAAADAGVEHADLVSVVLPVFNQADMVAGAVRSVLAQTYAPFELIIVDDGSSDDLHAALQPFVEDPRVRIVTQANQGLPKALSTGFEFATGEFFTWTSADNVMHEDQLTRLVGFLRDKPDVTMVYADYELIDEQGEPLVGGEFRVMDRTDKSNLSVVRVNRSTHDLNRYEDNFIGACFMYRGQVGRLLGDYNPELGLEDYDYWMRINRLFAIEHLGSDDILYRYRVHENTLSARARELKIQERAKVLMGYERERTEWGKAPFQVVADDETRSWLQPLLPADASLQPLVDASTCADDNGDKVLLAVTPATLATLPLDGVSNNTTIACWFADSQEVYRAHQQLGNLPVAAFASDADTAARLAVFTRTVFRGAANADTLLLAQHFASNGSFFRRTRNPERLQRVVPTVATSATPMRVLLQLDTFGKGGLERVVEDLATSLIELGCEVGLLALDGTSTTAELPERIVTVELDERTEAAYKENLKLGNWHVVSAHASTFGANVAHEQHVPFVQVVHNSYVWLEPDEINTYRTADAHTAAYACVSAQALGYADLRLQLDVQKMLVIENGITETTDVAADTRQSLRAELGLGDDDFVFLQVASLQPAKAHRVAVEALARVRADQPTAKLVCLGSEMNPMFAATVRSDAVRLGIEDAIVFAGHRPDPDAFYAMADAFFLPSFWEGCSLAVWEAIRQGLPLVLSDVGAASEQLRHGRGALIPPPFESMFALDASNLAAITRDVDEGYVRNTARAMTDVLTCDNKARTVGLPHVAQRSTMARRHLLLMSWLRQGGTTAGIRRSIARAANDLTMGSTQA